MSTRQPWFTPRARSHLTYASCCSALPPLCPSSSDEQLTSLTAMMIWRENLKFDSTRNRPGPARPGRPGGHSVTPGVNPVTTEYRKAFRVPCHRVT